MRVLFVTSEAVPLIKTGGLGDVSGSLPRSLKNLRQDVRVILPAYREARARAGRLKEAATLSLPGSPEPVTLLEGRLADSTVKLYLVDAPDLFDRPGGPYSTPDGGDWPDNAHRFALFARAAHAVAMDRAGLKWRPELVHCNDWQSGLTPALLSGEAARPATVFTIHNLAYQGLFDWNTFQALHLPYEWWSLHAIEFHGGMSFIKGGLSFADWITTVSPGYAGEIRTPEFGYGLEALLNHRAERLRGILNGADYSVWSPNHDPHIARNYHARSLAGKAENKTALQRRFGLAREPGVPLLGHVGRLVEQKGIDLLLEALPGLMERRLQLVLLGSGQQHLEDALRAAAAAHPERIGVRIGYDEELAHQVEAGADAFLMPSRFEPCGLNQIYSLRYGTVPIVRRTGGLADTVVDAGGTALQDHSATGILFDGADPASLRHAIERALALYDQPHVWRRIMTAGMRQDFSWTRSAKQYLELYREAVAGRG